MQTFIDTDGSPWQFDDDVTVSQVDGVYTFTAPGGAVLNVPQTLRPYSGPLPVPPTLDQVVASKLAEFSGDCQADIYSGFHSSALGADYLYPAKATDQQNLASSVLASLLPAQPDDWTTPFWCADADGEWAFRPHTAAQIQQVGKDGKARILACMAQNVALAAQVQAATTVAAVQAIAWVSP